MHAALVTTVRLVVKQCLAQYAHVANAVQRPAVSRKTAQPVPILRHRVHPIARHARSVTRALLSPTLHFHALVVNIPWVLSNIAQRALLATNARMPPRTRLHVLLVNILSAVL
jgi:hypothetical protein